MPRRGLGNVDQFWRVGKGSTRDELPGANGGVGSIAAIIADDSAKSLALAAGSAVSAIFKASSVIVGVRV